MKLKKQNKKGKNHSNRKTAAVKTNIKTCVMGKLEKKHTSP